ncbi:MAG: hypothetical protein WC654_04610, partial [Patescibacteria group bacterium]
MSDQAVAHDVQGDRRRVTGAYKSSRFLMADREHWAATLGSIKGGDLPRLLPPEWDGSAVR